jgi:hypothetical protein
MAYCKQQGDGKRGKLTQGDVVRLGNGVVGEVTNFGGGSHQWVTVKSGGYTYTGKTHEAVRVSED